MTTQVTHVIAQLSLGGAGRALIDLANQSARQDRIEHVIVSLAQPSADAVTLARRHGLDVLCEPSATELHCRITEADIVQLHFWNAPELYEFLAGNLPPMRMLVLCHVNGEHSPHLVTRELAGMADMFAVTNPATLSLPQFREQQPANRIVLAWIALNPERLSGLQRAPHASFNVGFIGTLSFAKLHRDFVAMHAMVESAQARFLIYGNGNAKRLLRREAAWQANADRFDFRGYANDVRTALASLDIFGYPLCKDNYGTSELALQEAMAAGIPAVVFPFGGAAHVVEHEKSGLIVDSPAGYARAIERLYADPGERARMGAHAVQRIAQLSTQYKTSAIMRDAYTRLMSEPKRTKQPLRIISDCLGATACPTGAALLVTSLGDAASCFHTSLLGAPDSMVEAECRLANSSDAMQEVLIRYRNRFRNDAHLRLWCGLICLQRGHPAMAAAEFKSAMALGLDQPRVQRYFAEAVARASPPRLSGGIPAGAGDPGCGGR